MSASVQNDLALAEYARLRCALRRIADEGDLEDFSPPEYIAATAFAAVQTAMDSVVRVCGAKAAHEILTNMHHRIASGDIR